jgi:hypothetical protein
MLTDIAIRGMGGGLLKKGASEKLKTMIDEAQAAGSVRLFSVRHEFPMDWAKFKRVEIKGEKKTAELKLTLGDPFWSKGRLGELK